MAKQDDRSKWGQDNAGQHAAEVIGPHQRSDGSDDSPNQKLSKASFENLSEHTRAPYLEVPGTELRCYLKQVNEKITIYIGENESDQRLKLNAEQLASLNNVLSNVCEYIEQFKHEPILTQSEHVHSQKVSLNAETHTQTNYEVMHLKTGHEHKAETEREHVLVALVRADSPTDAIHITQQPNWHKAPEVIHCYTNAPRPTRPGDLISQGKQEVTTVGPKTTPIPVPENPKLEEAVPPPKHGISQQEKLKFKPKL